MDFCCQGDSDTVANEHTNDGADVFLNDGNASACRKSQLHACAQHVADVWTFNGDGSGFMMNFSLESVARIA